MEHIGWAVELLKLSGVITTVSIALLGGYRKKIVYHCKYLCQPALAGFHKPHRPTWMGSVEAFKLPFLVAWLMLLQKALFKEAVLAGFWWRA